MRRRGPGGLLVDPAVLHLQLLQVPPHLWQLLVARLQAAVGVLPPPALLQGLVPRLPGLHRLVVSRREGAAGVGTSPSSPLGPRHSLVSRVQPQPLVPLQQRGVARVPPFLRDGLVARVQRVDPVPGREALVARLAGLRGEGLVLRVPTALAPALRLRVRSQGDVKTELYLWNNLVARLLLGESRLGVRNRLVARVSAAGVGLVVRPGEGRAGLGTKLQSVVEV